MIPMFIGGWIVTLIGYALAKATVLLPVNFIEGLHWAISQTYILSGIFPVSDFWLAIIAIVTAWTIHYAIKAILWTLSILPIVKVPKKLPKSRG
jgi:uncharacterized membrane protein